MNKWLLFQCIIILLNFIYKINTVNILVLEEVASPSHHYFIKRLLLALVNKGHNVTALTAENVIETVPNLHYIHLDLVYDTIYNEMENSVDYFEMGELNAFWELFEFYEYGISICEGSIKSHGWKQLSNYPNDFKFDLVIHDFLCAPCHLAFLHKFKFPPLISLTAFNDLSYTTDLIGTILTPSISPHCTAKYISATFFQRVHNYGMQVIDNFLYNTYAINKMEKLVSSIFPNVTNLNELRRKTRLIMLNNDPAVDLPDQFPANVIKIGGLQIKGVRPLPQDLQKIMENAKTGAILFSLGTNIRSDMLGRERLIHILEAFKEIPEYTFLWKFESSDLPMEIPKNVYIRAWLPQNDILGHPNTKLFITHSGLLSTQESTWYGVPMLGIPIFADQFMNIEKSVRSGVAERLWLKDLTKDNLKGKILKLLNTPSYRENMKIRSQNFRDQKETPLERAIWWIEWVLRNPNATHLRSAGIDMNFMQRQSIDVIAFLTVVFLVIIFVSIYILMKILCCLCKSKKQKKIKKKHE